MAHFPRDWSEVFFASYELRGGLRGRFPEELGQVNLKTLKGEKGEILSWGRWTMIWNGSLFDFKETVFIVTRSYFKT